MSASGQTSQTTQLQGPHARAGAGFVSPVATGVWRLRVRVQPGAKKTETAGVYDAGGPCGLRARIKLAAPPVDGKANKALVVFVAKRLGLKNSQVSLDAGQASRDKSLLITTDNEPDWSLMQAPAQQ